MRLLREGGNSLRQHRRNDQAGAKADGTPEAGASRFKMRNEWMFFRGQNAVPRVAATAEPPLTELGFFLSGQIRSVDCKLQAAWLY
jgi:hypothetical protein